MALTLPVQAVAQNLIVNPDFDIGLSGWSVNPNGTINVTWDPADTDSNVNSGSARAAHDGLAGSEILIRQCVPVQENTLYSPLGEIFTL